MQAENLIAANIAFIKDQIASACAKANRKTEEVSLVAVTKTHDWPLVQKAVEAGVKIIGENRIQEALEKLPRPWPYSTEVHFIGHLQKNKAKKAVSTFSCIQTVDDLELLKILDTYAGQSEKILDILFEVNSSGEASKQGVHHKDDLFRLLDALPEMKNLSARGLMTIGPLGADERRNLEAFSLVRRWSEDCAARYKLPAWGTLSMGMSGDFDLAIREGSTMVRIGTALFGSRPRDLR